MLGYQSGGNALKTLALVAGAAAAAVTVTVVVVQETAGPSRSTASFCSYFYGEGGKLRSQWTAADKASAENPIGSLSTVFGAPAQIAAFLGHAAERSPDSGITDDLSTLSKGYQKMADSLGGSAGSIASGGGLGMLASGLVNSLALAGPEQRVDSYVTSTCGPPPTS